MWNKTWSVPRLSGASVHISSRNQDNSKISQVEMGYSTSIVSEIWALEFFKKVQKLSVRQGDSFSHRWNSGLSERFHSRYHHSRSAITLVMKGSKGSWSRHRKAWKRNNQTTFLATCSMEYCRVSRCLRGFSLCLKRLFFKHLNHSVAF